MRQLAVVVPPLQRRDRDDAIRRRRLHAEQSAGDNLDPFRGLVACGFELEDMLHLAKPPLFLPRSAKLVTELHFLAPKRKVHDERAHGSDDRERPERQECVARLTHPASPLATYLAARILALRVRGFCA